MTSRAGKAGLLIPGMTVVLLAALAAAGWWAFELSQTQVAQPPATAEMLVSAYSARTQADAALRGDRAAYAELDRTADNLHEIRTATLTTSQREHLGRLRSLADMLLEGKGDVEALQEAVDALVAQVPVFVEAIYALQGELNIQRQPVVNAQLERLRTLADSLPVLARGLFTDGAEADKRLQANRMEMEQIVRALQAGDPALGIVAIDGPELEQAVAQLAGEARDLSASLSSGRELYGALQPQQQAVADLQQLINELDVAAITVLRTVGDGAGAATGDVTRVYAALGLVALLALLVLGFWLRAARQSHKAAELAAQNEADQQAILQLLDELGNLADGDLTVQATVGEDITGAIADSINYAIEALRDLVATVNKGAILVEDATKQTQTSSKALESASGAQARQVKAATDAVHNMAASIDEVSGNAERSSDVARHSVDIAHKGGDAVRRTIEGMNTIRETIQDTSKRIKRLGESSQEIGDIVELINDIADQTNVLALNASIQASMAGEAGRGFAVVADEVQRLAERSATATKQIEVLVSTIQSDTNEAVASMERSTTDVVGGALLAENAGAALEEIEQVSNQIAMLVQNISGSSREQNEMAKKVLEIVERLNQISSETGSSAATTAKFISKLGALASQLRESVAGFVLPDDPATGQQAGKSGDANTGDGSASPKSAKRPQPELADQEAG